MHGLLPIVKIAASELLAVKASRNSLGDNLTGLAWYVIGGVSLIIALIFAGIAGYGYLQTMMPAPAASGVMALIFIAVAGSFAIAGRQMMRKDNQKKKDAHVEKFATQLTEQIAEFLDQDFSGPIRDNPKSALMTAAVAGFLAGGRLH